jgi:hypothetical protein
LAARFAEKAEEKMRLIRTMLNTGWLVLLIATTVLGRTSYTGYSGAPGSRGQCAASCHGNSGGTIQVSGFPTVYNPGQQYSITVSRSSGSSINQFNASIRLATGTQNAGTISASTRTASYNATGETNGVHLSSANQTDGTFLWTAPTGGAGTVKLYLTGMQGSSMSGANTSIILTATEQTTEIGEEIQVPNRLYIISNYPNPFNANTRINFTTPTAENVRIEIYDINGRKIANIFDSYIDAGDHSIIWDAAANPSGIYFCRMITSTNILNRRIVLLK